MPERTTEAWFAQAKKTWIRDHRRSEGKAENVACRAPERTYTLIRGVVHIARRGFRKPYASKRPSSRLRPNGFKVRGKMPQKRSLIVHPHPADILPIRPHVQN